jgi:hypothetical protein
LQNSVEFENIITIQWFNEKMLSIAPHVTETFSAGPGHPEEPSRGSGPILSRSGPRQDRAAATCRSGEFDTMAFQPVQ